jgi:hypothetical protein
MGAALLIACVLGLYTNLVLQLGTVVLEITSSTEFERLTRSIPRFGAKAITSARIDFVMQTFKAKLTSLIRQRNAI